MHTTIGHRRHIGQADEDCAPGPQPLDGEGIFLRDQIRERMRAGCRGQTLGQITVLRGVGDAIQRSEQLAPASSPIRGFGLGKSVGIEHDDRVQGRPVAVVGLDPSQIGLDESDTGYPAVIECASQICDTRLGNLE